MKSMRQWVALIFLGVTAASFAGAEEAIPAIPRVLPPPGTVELPPALREELESRIERIDSRFWEIDSHDHAADAGALLKAVRYAMRHGEFYSEKEIPLAAEMLDLAERRFEEMNGSDSVSWLGEKGRILRGYRSEIDDSFQPFGLEVPERLDLSRPVPLLVWLHGRGDKTTDLHFLNQCRSKSQAFGGFLKDWEDSIILYPFGRQCVGWKHAGEVDVFEAIEAVKADYPIDPDRIILAGFSMGGAGAWHIGAHYRDQFCAIHAGAGFAETKEYNNLLPENFPPDYEQTLWKVYDVPNYVVNLLNGPLLAYSGKNDKQKAAADLMARELAKVGHTLRHVIGAEVEHKYTAEAVEEIRTWLIESWAAGRRRPASRIEWRTPTLRYGAHDWLQLSGLRAHWEGARVTASWDVGKKLIQLQETGVTAFQIRPGNETDLAGVTVEIGGQTLKANEPGFPVNSLTLVRRVGIWQWGEPEKTAKRPGIQGPIDDAFLNRFVVVGPDAVPADPKLARWVDFELNQFRERWSALMRGDLPEKSADELNSDDITNANLILWGDPASNPMIAEIAAKLPIEWKGRSFLFRGESYSTTGHVPVFVFPNPLNPDRYVVINSGLTFREGHDRTNSLQNPKLPDWAVIGLDEDPDAFAPGRIVSAGFFNEEWK